MHLLYLMHDIQKNYIFIIKHVYKNCPIEFYGKLTKQQEQKYHRDCDYTMSVIRNKLTT